MSKDWNNHIKDLPKKRHVRKFWNNFTFTGKAFIVMFVFLIITSPITIQIGRLTYYMIVHGDEIESFEPYTMEQCQKDFAPYIN